MRKFFKRNILIMVEFLKGRISLNGDFRIDGIQIIDEVEDNWTFGNTSISNCIQRFSEESFEDRGFSMRLLSNNNNFRSSELSIKPKIRGNTMKYLLSGECLHLVECNKNIVGQCVVSILVCSWFIRRVEFSSFKRCNFSIYIFFWSHW